MRPAVMISVAVVLAVASLAVADDRRWENPVFLSTEEAVAAAREAVKQPPPEQSGALRLFADLTLASGDMGDGHSSASTVRDTVGNLLITHPSGFAESPVQASTIERFKRAIPKQRSVLEGRLARFGYPELPGMVYCRLVESVDAFAGLGPASSDKMSQVGGVTYYCRYVVLPLSYVGEAAVAELRRSAALNPGLDVEGTIRGWQSESFANLINTFRHELVHVHTNTTLGVPAYSNRSAVPTWFHEGTATYLAADPHSGLSERYKEYQDLFFYLVQRHGVPRLQEFFTDVLGGSTVATALGEVYSIPGSDELFARSARWHGVKERLKTVLWIIGLGIVIAAFRGADRPYVGYFLIMTAVVLALAVAAGIAEHLYGLRGPAVVIAAKTGFVLLALVAAIVGVRRIRRHTGRSATA